MINVTANLAPLTAAASFSFAASVSPGLNTLMLANSGANHGIHKTLPMLLGCNIGLLLMLLVVALGAGELFILFPWLHNALLYFCTGYLLYLGYQLSFVSRKPSTQTSSNASTPIGFIQATSIQFINPGIWMIAIASMGFATQVGNSVSAALAICVIVTLANFPAIAIWALSGGAISKRLQCPRKQKIFNMTLTLLTLATIPMLWLN